MADEDLPARIEVEWLDGPSAVADVDAPTVAPGRSRSRSWVVLVAIVVAGVIAASWLSARPEQDSPTAGETIAPTTSTVPAAATDSPSTTDARDENVVEIGVALSFPVVFDEGWLAMRSSGSSELVWSADGFNWSHFDSELPSGNPLLLESTDVGLVLVLAKFGVADDVVGLQVWLSKDGSSWVLDDETRGSIEVFGDSRIAAGDRVAMVDLAVGDEPMFVELVDVLSEIIDPADASRVCRVENRFDAEPTYVFYGCDGEDVFELSVRDSRTLLDPGRRQCLDLLTVATTELETLKVLDPSAGDIEIVLHPLERVLEILSTEDGFVVVIVNFGDFFSPTGPCDQLLGGRASGLYLWTSTSDLTQIELPVVTNENPFGFGLAGLEDGGLLLARPDGAYTARAPFDDWTLLLEPPVSDGGMGVSKDGRVLVYRASFNEAWVAPVGGEWVEFDLEGNDFAMPLLGTDEYAILTVFGRAEVELVRVPYDDG